MRLVGFPTTQLMEQSIDIDSKLLKKALFWTVCSEKGFSSIVYVVVVANIYGDYRIVLKYEVQRNPVAHID